MRHPQAVRDWLLDNWERVLGSTVVVLLLATPWLVLIPMGIFRGIAVVEVCDRKARERYGINTFTRQGEEHVRLLPPAWVCPLSNDEAVTLSIATLLRD